MKYVILVKAGSRKPEIVEVSETKSIYSELAKIINVPLVEIVKTEKMKKMTEVSGTKKFMCMAIDDMGFSRETPVVNPVGSYLYDGTIVGDVVLCTIELHPFEHIVDGFNSEEEALEWFNKIKIEEVIMLGLDKQQMLAMNYRKDNGINDLWFINSYLPGEISRIIALCIVNEFPLIKRFSGKWKNSKLIDIILDASNDGIDVSNILDDKFEEEILKEIVEYHKDLIPYVNYFNNSDDLAAADTLLKYNSSPSYILNYSFDFRQKLNIVKGAMDYLDIEVYAKPGFNAEQMEEIRLGLERELDVSVYAKPEFDDLQMHQIRSGLENNLDVSIYAKSYFNDQQMHEIRRGLENGLDVSVYANPEFNSDQMEEMRESLLK